MRPWVWIAWHLENEAVRPLVKAEGQTLASQNARLLALSNRQRDLKVRAALLAMGWRVGVVWECALKAKVEGGVSDTALAVANWLTGSNTDFELPPNC